MCHITSWYSHACSERLPRVSNTTKQEAPPCKGQHEDQGALQKSHGVPLKSSSKNGKNIAPHKPANRWLSTKTGQGGL